jgi:DNA-binding SARP family transcriptional activator
VIELRLLGPVEVLVDGHPVPLPPKPRALLALLALELGRAVSTDRIVDTLWDEAPPEQAIKTVQVYVSQLRRTLGADRIETVGGGYRLAAERVALDSAHFERLVREGRTQLDRGEPAQAAEALEDALALWHGPALADLPWRDEAARLEELRLGALEALADAELELGHHARLVPELEQRTLERPERERTLAQLMLALYRSGRQEEALDAFHRAREGLVERLGVEPGPELRDLQQRILRQDPELAAPRAQRPTTPPAEPPSRRRWVPAAAVVLLAVAGAAVALVLVLGGSSGDGAGVRSYVLKVENFLGQSHDAHGEIVQAIVAARRCTTPPARSAAAIERVERSRQSLLEQLAATSVPSDPQALRSFDLLQQAVQASIAADWRFRDWLRAQRRCPQDAPLPQSLLALDARATRLKASFVDAFDPLARRFDAVEWKGRDF